LLAQHQQIRQWREEHARLALNIGFEPLSDAPFRATIKPIFEDLHITRIALPAGLTFRDDQLVKDGKDNFALLISTSKDLRVALRGQNLRLGRGDATLVHVGETGSVGSGQNFGRVGVHVPHPELAARETRPNDAVMQLVPRRSEALQLLRAYLDSLERCRLGASRDTCEVIRCHIVDLTALAITTHAALGESNSSAVAAARLRTALDHIAASFEDPELSLASVARRQGISPRYLQRLFETTGTSFTTHVNELRLQRAFTLLTEARDRASRISDIALQVGFSDISHFNRLFRSSFGDTPSGVRGRSRTSG
jgi:AraC-like DNA-binding protein